MAISDQFKDYNHAAESIRAEKFRSMESRFKAVRDQANLVHKRFYTGETGETGSMTIYHYAPNMFPSTAVPQHLWAKIAVCGQNALVENIEVAAELFGIAWRGDPRPTIKGMKPPRITQASMRGA